MKKITLTVFALFITLGLFAQTHFGIKGGLNFDSMKDIKVENTTRTMNNTGWHAGVALLAKLGLGFAFQPELLYSVRSYGWEDVKFNLNYIELPLNVQWGIDLLILRPFVMASPYISYMVSMGGEANEWKGVKNLDYGFGLGVGLDLWKLQVTGKYNWALGKLGNVQINEWKLKDANRSVFQLSVGLMF